MLVGAGSNIVPFAVLPVMQCAFCIVLCWCQCHWTPSCVIGDRCMVMVTLTFALCLGSRLLCSQGPARARMAATESNCGLLADGLDEACLAVTTAICDLRDREHEVQSAVMRLDRMVRREQPASSSSAGYVDGAAAVASVRRRLLIIRQRLAGVREVLQDQEWHLLGSYKEVKRWTESSASAENPGAWEKCRTVELG